MEPKIIRKNQIIASAGLNSNNICLTEACLEKCVKTVKNDKLPIVNNYNEREVIGYMDNFQYKDGKILADVYLIKNLSEKDLSYAIESIEKEENVITEMNLLWGTMVDRLDKILEN